MLQHTFPEYKQIKYIWRAWGHLEWKTSQRSGSSQRISNLSILQLIMPRRLVCLISVLYAIHEGDIILLNVIWIMHTFIQEVFLFVVVYGMRTFQCQFCMYVIHQISWRSFVHKNWHTSFHRAVRCSTVRYDSVHPDPACVSTTNSTLTWFAHHLNQK